MKDKQSWRKNLFLVRDTEIRIKRRLDRATHLEDLDVTTIEQLNYLSKTASDDQLSKALNAALAVE